VPAFIAATYIMSYAPEHKLYSKPSDLPEISDTIMIYKPLHFEQITSILQISIEKLRNMNPQYRRDVIPANEDKGYVLMLSAEQSLQFASFEDSIFNYRRNNYFPNNRLVVNPSDTKYPVTSPTGRAAIYYTVKSGDVLGLIADWFNVKVSDLKYWNDISGNLIKPGQRLIVYVPKNKEEHYKMVSQARSGKQNTTTKQTTSVQTQKQTDENVKYEYYEVKNGDTLWSITKKFPGVSNDDIIKLNDITDEKKIKPGQKLKIRVNS
jgi:membrane-bound lytic murein transglycosylase D